MLIVSSDVQSASRRYAPSGPLGFTRVSTVAKGDRLDLKRGRRSKMAERLEASAQLVVGLYIAAMNNGARIYRMRLSSLDERAVEVGGCSGQTASECTSTQWESISDTVSG